MRPRRPTRGPSPQLLLALWVAGAVLFNFPMLIVFDRDATVLGLPLLPIALFAIWALLIAALAWAMERGAAPTDDGPGSRAEAEVPPPPVSGSAP